LFSLNVSYDENITKLATPPSQPAYGTCNTKYLTVGPYVIYYDSAGSELGKTYFEFDPVDSYGWVNSFRDIPDPNTCGVTTDKHNLISLNEDTWYNNGFTLSANLPDDISSMDEVDSTGIYLYSYAIIFTIPPYTPQNITLYTGNVSLTY